MATPEQPPRAAALRYRKGETAPALVASGRGHVADAILAAAEEAGIPVREDAMLVEALAHLDGLLAAFARDRATDEAFGDWLTRTAAA